MTNGKGRTCAFCRTKLPKSDEEYLVYLRKRVELKDPRAMLNMAMNYGRGNLGLSLDQAKCIDLLRQSAGLGLIDAQHNLGNLHHAGDMGLERNKEEGIKYLEKAAGGGDVFARHNLGVIEYENGDHVAAMRHCRLSASGGYKPSIEALIVCFEEGLLHHGDLSETLQVFYRARAEMRSEDRDQFIECLKKTGRYKEEYDY